ncbi:DUF192 domain-containing protein [Patescibacteria group bacterium]|nr:DUF192 domain-containing protein [Patescibacteria group bacterium]
MTTRTMLLLLPVGAALIVLAVIVYWFFIAVPVAASPVRLMVDEHVFSVEIADTPQKQIRGLSGRPSLAEGQGMLFLFGEEAIHGMWMPNMKFDIDILWILDGKVVEIATLPAPTLKNPVPARYTPQETAKWVLELPAGTAQKQGISVGSEVKLGTR